MTTKRVLIVLIILYVALALIGWFTRSPLAYLVAPLAVIVGISPMIIIAVLVYKFMERRKVN